MPILWKDLFRELPFVVEKEAPWSILTALDDFFKSFSNYNLADWFSKNLDKVGKVEISGKVYIAEDAQIENGVTIIGPAYIASKAIVRQGAYLRGGVYLGEGAVAGHTTEIKRAVLLKNSHAPHFNYVGDSVLGENVNLGAGVKISNFKNDGSVIYIDKIDTGLIKAGAFVGDNTKIGCNTVTAPGTIIGKDCFIYPLTFVRGIIPENSIVKLKPDLEIKVKD